MKKLVYILFIFVTGDLISFGQEGGFRLEINSTCREIEVDKASKLKDSAAVYEILNNTLFDAYEKGFLKASFDSIFLKDSTYYATLNCGEKIKWGSIDLSAIENSGINRGLLRLSGYRKKPVNAYQIAKMLNNIIVICENNGYPFARAYLDSMQLLNDTLYAKLVVEKNQLIVIDSIVIAAKQKVNARFLYQYLDIQPGDVYVENKLTAIDKKISDLPFYKTTRKTSYEFTPEGLNLFLFLDKVKSNQFNGIIGFQPGSSTSRQLVITGDINLHLLNSFNFGETVFFHWKKFDALSQYLNTGIAYPYLFYTPFGLDARIEIDKQDTSYINTTSNLGLTYDLGVGRNVSVYYKRIASNAAESEVNEPLNNIPDFADSESNLFGMGLQFSKLDYPLNPSKGYIMEIDFAGGKKNLDKDLADQLNTAHENNYEIKTDMGYYQRLVGNFVGFLSSHAGHKSSHAIFENETYKVGGFSDLRGFDERSINATSYTLFNVELRYLYEQNSSAFLFWNGMYYEKNLISEEKIDDFPYGFGLGVNFETRAGIFSLAYAIGKQFDNPIDFRAAKIHFGFSNRF